ncbi:MAG: hypothetical protein WCG23_04270 [bacterium]
MSFSVNRTNGQHRQQPPSGGNPPQEIISALKAGGATSAQLAAINGPESAKSLADSLGVNLPEPPQPPQDGIFDGQNNANSTNNNQGNSMKAQVDAQLKAAGATSTELANAQAQGIEGIKALAAKYGVQLPQPPQPPQGTSSSSSSSSSNISQMIASLLQSLGISA